MEWSDEMSWMVVGVLLNSLGQSLVISYPYCLLRALMADDSPMKIDVDTATWLASCVGITFIIGPYLAIFLYDYFGRRVTHAMVVIPCVSGWLCIYFSNNVNTITVGRLLLGLYNSIAFSSGCVYVGECTSPEYRGIFLNMKTSIFSTGSVLMHVMTEYFNWRTIALLSMIPGLLSFLNTCTWMESPPWLASKGRFEQCEENFYWLRGSSEKSVSEFKALVAARKREMSPATKLITWREKLKHFANKFIQRDFVKPLLLIIFASALLESSGRHYFPAYAFELLGATSKDKSTIFIYTICIDFTFIVSNSISNVFVKMINRRTLLFSSATLAVVLLLVTCLYVYLVSIGVLSSDKPWILAAILGVYFMCANCGCTALPLVIMGEIFPLRHRDTAMAVSGTFTAIILTVFLKYPPIWFIYIKVHGALIVCVCVMIISMVYLYFFLPETRNKTLEEIETFFSHGKFPDVDDKTIVDDTDTELIKTNNVDK